MSTLADSRKQIPFSVEPLNLTCEWENCFIIEEDIENLITHVAMEHIPKLMDGDLHCHWKDCEGFTESLPELRRHILFHAFHTKIKCYGSNLQIRKKLPNCSSSIHSRNIVPELPDPLICGWEDCLTMYECAEHFYRHVDSHATHDSKKQNEDSASCLWEGCNRTFNDQHKVKEHLRSHTQEKVIACPTCGGMFASRTKFFDHIQRQLPIDDEEGAYICEYCSRRSSSERLLRDHMRHHVNHYKCPYCDMTCPTPSGLQIHMSYRHSEVKPHSCPYCDYRGKSENDLRKHLESHSLAPTYNCPAENCSYATRSQTCYSVHYRKAHEKKEALKYSCHLCEKIFTRGNYLTKHLLKIHKFRWPSGHCRFRYNLNEDGCYRLQTVRYESLELSETMMAETAESIDNPDDIIAPSIPSEQRTDIYSSDIIAPSIPSEQRTDIYSSDIIAPSIPSEQRTDIYSSDISVSESQMSNKQVLHSSNPVINGSVVVCVEGGRNAGCFNSSDSSTYEEKPVLIKILEAPENSLSSNREQNFFASHFEKALENENLLSQSLSVFSSDTMAIERDILPEYESFFSQQLNGI